MGIEKAYGRGEVVEYAHRWAFGRNPLYFNYDNIGGDCTNFASQCIFAGAGTMNYTTDFGWYYINGNNKAPAWTGVEFLYSYLTRNSKSAGPLGSVCSINEVEQGDIIQLLFNGEIFQHTLVVVSAKNQRGGREILVASHSDDSDNRELSTYSYRDIRFLHIHTVYK